MRVGLMGIYLMGGDIDVSFATILCTTMTQEAHLGSKLFCACEGGLQYNVTAWRCGNEVVHKFKHQMTPDTVGGRTQ